jgi:tetratricopeptide (TPR) repeat protein
MFSGSPNGSFAPVFSLSSVSAHSSGEIFFAEKKYRPSVNEFREALNGDLKPKWVEVWAHVNLGKIFDITGQRDRALDQYRLAIGTGDNTRGAQDEATKYTEEPYKRD